MPDEQYPTMPFRSPYIHTADSGPSAIVYYPQPIYEAIEQPQPQAANIYSHVTTKKADDKALERLSALVMSTEAAPLAKPEDSGSNSVVSGSEARGRCSTIFQELDEAFTTLDLELGEMPQPQQDEADADEATSGGEKSLVLSEPANV